MFAKTMLLLTAVGLASTNAQPSFSNPPTAGHSMKLFDAQTLRSNAGPHRFPVRFSQGVAVTFILKGDDPADQEVPLTLPPGTRSLLNVNGTLFISRQTMLHDQEGLERELVWVCEINRTSTFRLRSLYFTTAKQLAQYEAAKKRDEMRNDRESRENAVRWDRERRQYVPELGEVDKYLRANWGKGYFFDPSETKFHRVRDSKCKRRGFRFVCVVGVLTTGKEGPDYEQSEMIFRRDETAEGYPLTLIEPEIKIIN